MTSRLQLKLQGKPVDRPPVWLMRQAGRFHPTYRALRANFSHFMDFCANDQAASDATMIPINAYPELDAAIIFSDILTIPQALGLDVVFEAGVGPKISGSLHPSHWKTHTESHLTPTYKAISLTRKRLAFDKSLLGFCGAPWTLLAYMINGKNKNEFASARAAALANTQQYQDQLQMITHHVTAHAKRQIEAGADAIMLFDSWAGLLPEQAFLRSVIEPLKQITTELRSMAPVIVFMRSSAQHIKFWDRVPANVFQVDFTANLLDVHNALPNHLIQGNLDPAILLSDKATIIAHTQHILDLPLNNQLIFNLGHGVLPSTDPEAVQTLLQTIHQSRV